MGHLYHSYLKLSEGNNGIVWDNTAINLPGNNTYGTIALRCVVKILVLQNLSQSLPSRFCIITNAIFIDHTHFHKHHHHHQHHHHHHDHHHHHQDQETAQHQTLHQWNHRCHHQPLSIQWIGERAQELWVSIFYGKLELQSEFPNHMIVIHLYPNMLLLYKLF